MTQYKPLKVLLQEKLDTPKKDLIKNINASRKIVWKAVKEQDKNSRGKKMTEKELMSAVFFTCATVDNTLTVAEYELMCSVLGRMTKEKANALFQSFLSGKNEMLPLLDELADSLEWDAKNAFLDIVVDILCIDGRLEAPEISYIQKLIN